MTVFNRFTAEARRAVTAAADEADRRGDQRIGTEHLLLALIADPRSQAHAALGVDVADARAALDRLDIEALAAVGIIVETAPTPVPSERLPRGGARFSAAAKGVMAGSLRAAVTEKSKVIESRHLLLAVLSCPTPDPAADLLAALAVDPAQVRARLAEAA